MNNILCNTQKVIKADAILTRAKSVLGALFLFSSILLTSWSVFASPEALERASAENAFLKDLYTHTRLFLHINAREIEIVYDCLADKKNNLDPDVCNQKMTHVYRELQLNHPKAQHFLFLSHLFKQDNFVKLNALLKANLIQNIVKAKTVSEAPLTQFAFAHPLEYSLQTEYIPKQIWSPGVIESGLNGLWTEGQKDRPGFNQIFADICKTVFIANPNLNLQEAKIQRPKDTSFCDGIVLKYRPLTSSFYFEFLTLRDQSETNLARIAAALMVPEAAKQHELFKAAFLNMIQTVPYVGLVSQAQPHKQELLTAYSIMHKASQDLLNDFYEREEFYKNSVPSTTRISSNRWIWLKLFRYRTVAKDLLDNPGNRMMALPSYAFDELEADLSSEYDTNELAKFVGQGLILIGSQIAVCSRGGRFLGPLARFSLLKKYVPGLQQLCMPVTSLIVNIGFVADAQYEYTKTYKEVFASQSHKQLLREIEDLNSAELNVLINAVAMPMGATMALKALSSLSSRLTQSSLAHLNQIIQNAALVNTTRMAK